MADLFKTEQEIEAVVSGFENCTTSKERFTHVSHLTVATYYLINSTPKEAFEKMRSSLLRFLKHHGVNSAKYSDRVTLAWIREIQRVIEQMETDCSLVSITNGVLEQLGQHRITVENLHDE
jgi:hypothetical protein